MTKDQLLAEVMALPPREREDLADEIWRSVDGETREQVEAAWAEEVRRRLDVHVRSGATAKPVDEVIERLRTKSRQ